MAKTYYDNIAEGYDELYGEEQKRKTSIIKENIRITKESRILDLGCGTGISSSFGCFCIGIDPSEGLIKIARKNNKRKGNKFLTGSAEKIEEFKFEDKEFDYVLCISAVHHFKSLKKVLREIRRIGRVFVVSIIKKSRKKQKIINTLNSEFNIIKEIDEGKDIILICE